MAGTGETRSFRALEDRSNQIAQLFRKLGLKVGDGIAIFMENNIHYLEIAWAAQRSGLYYTPISWRLTAGEAEYIVRDCAAKVLITSHALAKVAGELAPRLKDVALFVIGGVIPGYRSYEDAIAAEPAKRIPDEASGSAMMYSSGTTGHPKGVRRALENVPIDQPSSMTLMMGPLYGFDANTVYLSPAPLYHAAPLYWSMGIHRIGGTVIVMERFDAEAALALIERYRVTGAQFVPTMFVRMLKLPDTVRTRYDLSSLKAAIHAAAPCPIDVKRKMIEWWGEIIHEYYSGTEGNGFCYVTSQDWLAHPGTVGRSTFGNIHICTETGEEVPIGREGIVYFEGGAPFAYHNDPKKTADTRNPMRPDWSTLGDIGKLDHEGYLYLTDRKAFMIISGGVNIYPQEVENLLIGHPKVTDVAVFGVPNEEFGEEVKAVVQPADWRDAGPTLAEELTAYCRENLSPIKCPRSIDFDPELPREPTGKLYKRLIRDRYWGDKRESRII